MRRVAQCWWPPSPPSSFPHSTWLPGKLDSNSCPACLGARFPICLEITLNSGSCGGLKAMLDIPESLKPAVAPRSHISSSALLASCCRPWQGFTGPGGTSASSTGGMAELGAGKASCKPKWSPAKAGSDESPPSLVGGWAGQACRMDAAVYRQQGRLPSAPDL